MFLTLFLVLFAGLKLGGVIGWSWFFVLFPLYLIVIRFLFNTFLIESIKQTKRTGVRGWGVNLMNWIKDMSK